MAQDTSNKVIHIFQHHGRGELHAPPADACPEGRPILSPDGFYYVSFLTEPDGLNTEENLLEVADKKAYLIKMMEMHHEGHAVRINHYHVPQERLDEFLRTLPSRPGKLLEIQQFIPDGTA